MHLQFCLQNNNTLSDDFNVVGSSFQMPGAATEKACLPIQYLVLILHVSWMTKNYSDAIDHYFNIFPPLAAEKSGGTIDRVTADSRYNGVLCSGVRLYLA